MFDTFVCKMNFVDSFSTYIIITKKKMDLIIAI